MDVLKQDNVVGVVGLGYVGLPLAAAFGKQMEVVGFDVNESRIRELQRGEDATGEVDRRDLSRAQIRFTTDPEDLRSCDAVIVAVPTPVDKARRPDLSALLAASHTVGRILAPGMLVVYESTVYPGVTEEVCLPVLRRESGLELGQFDLGYSPERINPGDREHTLENVVKVVSGHSPAACERVAGLYSRVVRAGVHKAPSIKTAEAAKVIENIQRDLNIALMNELSKIFARIGIHTDEVLAAAATKWNFHRYHPGLVGGHCIGVDPYYMTHLALQLDMHPRVILAGRETNDGMGRYVGGLVARELSRVGKRLKDARVVILGLTFKENVPDCRNSRAVDVVRYLQEFEIRVFGCEPLISDEQIRDMFGAEPVSLDALPEADAYVIINKHDVFRSIRIEDFKRLMEPPLLFDLKNLFDRYEARRLGIRHFSL